MAGPVRLVNPTTGSVVVVSEEKAERLSRDFGYEAEKSSGSSGSAAKKTAAKKTTARKTAAKKTAASESTSVSTSDIGQGESSK